MRQGVRRSCTRCGNVADDVVVVLVGFVIIIVVVVVTPRTAGMQPIAQVQASTLIIRASIPRLST